MTGIGLGRGKARAGEPPALAGLQEPSRDPWPKGRQQPPEPPSATEWRDPSIMGTPASIACDLPQHQTPKACTRKRASANIFQGVGLFQLRRLFHSSGDAQAEERAQLVWECAGSRCIAHALQQLRRRQRKLRLRSHLRPPSEMSGGTRLLELQHFSRLRYGLHVHATLLLQLLHSPSNNKATKISSPLLFLQQQVVGQRWRFKSHWTLNFHLS
nr:arginine vasopressin-induced protein 1 isoform X1 [Zootoca vivipara]